MSPAGRVQSDTGQMVMADRRANSRALENLRRSIEAAGASMDDGGEGEV